MQTRPIAVVETSLFLRQAEKIWSDEERAVLVDYMARNPVVGDIIPGPAVCAGYAGDGAATASVAEHG